MRVEDVLSDDHIHFIPYSNEHSDQISGVIPESSPRMRLTLAGAE
jgi:hypothetical protein